LGGFGEDVPDVNLGPRLVKTVWCLLALSTVVLCARFFVKIKTVRKLYIDDYLMMIALVLGEPWSGRPASAC